MTSAREDITLTLIHKAANFPLIPFSQVGFFTAIGANHNAISAIKCGCNRHAPRRSELSFWKPLGKFRVML